jgi:hypothetical protein
VTPAENLRICDSSRCDGFIVFGVAISTLLFSLESVLWFMQYAANHVAGRLALDSCAFGKSCKRNVYSCKGSPVSL